MSCKSCGRSGHNARTCESVEEKLSRVEKVIAAMKRDNHIDDELEVSARLCLASLVLGPDEEAISRATGMSMELLAPRAENLRRAMIWSGGKIYGGQWLDRGSKGAISLVLDILVAEGLVVRVNERHGIPRDEPEPEVPPVVVDLEPAPELTPEEVHRRAFVARLFGEE